MSLEDFSCGHSATACTLAGSGLTPSSETTCPRNSTSRRAKVHLLYFAYSFRARRHSKTARRSHTCASAVALCTRRSSRYTNTQSSNPFIAPFINR